MAYQVFERGWLSSNNILFFDDDGATLVDTGYCTHAAQTIALVDAALMKLRLESGNDDYSLTRIINTHLHSDHCGGNAALITHYPRLQVLIPAAEAKAVDTWDEALLSYKATGQQCPRFLHTQLMQAGDRLQLGGESWQVCAAPGHDPHSIILFNPASRVLISADALWQDGCGVIFPELRGEPGFDAALSTLDAIEALGPAMVIPGHGAAFSEVSTALNRARQRLHYLSADPARNAAHGLRVLMKFRLLESSQIDKDRLIAWFIGLDYFQSIHELYFSHQAPMSLAVQTLERLIAAKAASLSGAVVLNSP